MLGAIAEAFYGGVPKSIADFAMAKLDDNPRATVSSFYRTYGMTNE